MSGSHLPTLIRRAGRSGQRRLARASDSVRSRVAPTLGPREALRENGFTVFRAAFSTAECQALTRTLKRDAGIVEGERYTSIDAINRLESAREIFFDPRVLGSVRACLGQDVRFLQVSDLHYRHDTFGWHRDSVHRAVDSSEAPDWSDSSEPYGVVKAILYLESENAAMGIVPGSHADPREIDLTHVKRVEKKHGEAIVGTSDNPNRRFSGRDTRDPIACRLEVGDLLVFDERMYHAGRRVQDGLVSTDQAAPKFTLSMVFGLDNTHSERMYSYFRYARRDLNFADLAPELVHRLDEQDLVLRSRWANFYERCPNDLRFAYLRDPSQLGTLMAEFAAAGAQR